MILDFDHCEDGQAFAADVCIIGAGAAGIALARELAQARHPVVLVAGGGDRHVAEVQRLYDSEVTGLAHTGIHEGRARVFGGTTTWWAGQALPLDEIDFQARDWVPDSGWPITRAELEPFYRRAERVMNLPGLSYDAAAWPASAAPPPPFDPGQLRAAVSQFSPTPDFAATYRAELEASPHVRVLLHAHATAIVTNEAASAVERVELKGLGGRAGSVSARHHVVCCGGIETARLLLASDRIEPYGLGNAHDLVGRYFQDHIHIKAVRIEPTDRKRLQAMFDPCYFRGIKHAPKIASSVELQRRHRILNVAGDLCYDIPEDSAVEAAKLILRAARRRDLRARLPRAVRDVARRPHELARAAFKYFVLKQPVSENRGPIYLGVQAEARPNPESRVYLGTQVDALGMRRSVLDWRLTAEDRRTIEVFVRAVADEFRRLGLGAIDPSSLALPDDPAQLDRRVHDANHHMGTTRMHDDPRRGVVDRHCRVHGVANLFIGSSAVFPTGGYSNPTLTILALCLRLADRLKQRPDAGALGLGAPAGRPAAIPGP